MACAFSLATNYKLRSATADVPQMRHNKMSCVGWLLGPGLFLEAMIEAREGGRVRYEYSPLGYFTLGDI